MSSVPQSKRIKQVFGSTTCLDIEFEDEAGGLDVVALRHAIASDQSVPVALDPDGVHPLLDAVYAERPWRRDDTHWRHQHYAPALRQEWAEAQARADRARRRAKREAEREQRAFAEAQQTQQKTVQWERWVKAPAKEQAERIVQRTAAVVQPPREPTDGRLRAGALILTCDDCPASYRSAMQHRGGAVDPSKLEMLRALARSVGWSTHGADLCPRCAGFRDSELAVGG